MITRTGCTSLLPGTGDSSTRTFCPSLRPPSRPRLSTWMMEPMSACDAPRSLRIEASVSPFLAMMIFSLNALPPVASRWVFGSSVTFSGTTRAPKPA